MLFGDVVVVDVSCRVFLLLCVCLLLFCGSVVMCRCVLMVVGAWRRLWLVGCWCVPFVLFRCLWFVGNCCCVLLCVAGCCCSLFVVCRLLLVVCCCLLRCVVCCCGVVCVLANVDSCVRCAL